MASKSTNSPTKSNTKDTGHMQQSPTNPKLKKSSGSKQCSSGASNISSGSNISSPSKQCSSSGSKNNISKNNSSDEDELEIEPSIINISNNLKPSTKYPEISSRYKQEIEQLYQSMLDQYYSTRTKKYLHQRHKDDFINGVWKSIIQLRHEGITSENIDHVAKYLDMAHDVIANNVVFFLYDFNGEEQLDAEQQYHDYIISKL